MSELTRISVSKTTNRNLTVLCARLGVTKVRLLEKLSKTPTYVVKKFLDEPESLAETPNVNQDSITG